MRKLIFVSAVVFSTTAVAAPKALLCKAINGEQKVKERIEFLQGYAAKLDQKAETAKAAGDASELRSIQKEHALAEQIIEGCKGAEWVYADLYTFDTDAFTDPDGARVTIKPMYNCGHKHRPILQGKLIANPHELVITRQEKNLDLELVVNRATLDAKLTSTTNTGPQSTRSTQRVCEIREIDVSDNKI